MNRSAQVLATKLRTLSSLSAGDLELIDRVIPPASHYEARRDLIREGEVPQYVMLVVQGFACRYKTLRDGKRHLVALLLPGDCGDLHAPLLDHMDHGIATHTACLIAKIPREGVLDMLESPALEKALRRSTLVDEAILREWLLNIGQRRSEERLAHLLCELHHRLRAIGMAGEAGYDLPLTQAELGEIAGLSTVHVNRVVKELRRRELVYLRRGRVEIPDPRRLAWLCGFNANYLHQLAEAGTFS
ncbi:MAG: helix-turn-helix domain-containing protein [Alphaproteobacteria bacterium]|nr:helix-turn-helix domain-containing protein [Alphaproteobacteria bacterium]